MAPQKVYTIGVSNKFAGLGYESSSDEEGAKRAPKIVKGKVSKGPSANSTSLVVNTTNSAANFSPQAHSSKENRLPDGRIAARNGRHENAESREGLSELGAESRVFRGGRGRGGAQSGSRWGYRGRGGFRGGNQGRAEDDGELVNGSAENTNGTDGAMSPQKAPRNARRGRGGYDAPWGFRGRRDFDRHSSTGRGPEMKKDGGGGHNWGNEEADWGCDNADKSVSKSLEVTNSDAEVKKEGDHIPESGPNQAEPAEDEKLPTPEPETLDFDAYKAQQAAKRVNLPQLKAANQGGIKITTIKDLESQGYTRHVKNSEDEEEESEEDTSDEETDSENEQEDDDARKKKTMNVFEYIHSEGGRVRLFPGRRGGRGGGPGERRGFEHRENYPRRKQFSFGKDTPDIQDERAFPKLG